MMKKITVPVILTFLSALVAFGCTSMFKGTKTVAIQGLRMVPMDYKVIGDTTAEDTRMSVFYLDWSHLVTDEYAECAVEQMNGDTDSDYSSWTLEGQAMGAAMYKALQKIPDADRLIEPRWTIQVKNYLIVKVVTVNLTAKAIQFTESNPMSK